MTLVLRHPFTFGSDGSAITIDDTSDDFCDQQIDIVILSRLQERRMQPGFGIPNPAWAGVEIGDVQAVFDEFMPDLNVTITSLTATSETADTSKFDLKWDRTT